MYMLTPQPIGTRQQATDGMVPDAANSERPLWVESGLSRMTANDPLQPFEESTKPRSIQFDIFRGGAGLFPGTPENELTDVRGGELPVATPSLCRQAPSPCKPQTSGRGF